LAGYHLLGENGMHDALLMLYVRFQNLTGSEEGQDLVEYALLCTLIALGLIASIGNIATALNKVFTNVSTSLA